MFIFTIETILTIVVITLLVLIHAYYAIKKHFKQSRCDHSDYRETMACDAVCVKCSKNLGFIGTIRDKQKQTTQK